MSSLLSHCAPTTPARCLPWRARALPLLGTRVEISAPARDDEQLRRWADTAFARIAAFHAAMSFHSAGSDLAAIARAPAGSSVQLQADTWHTLALALELEAATSGRFDCAVAPVLVQRGLLPVPEGAVPPLAQSARAALRLLDGWRVRVEQTVWIDLGGIAKGAAVDAAVLAMQAAGAPAGLVNAGGDLRVFGDEPRRISLRDPRCPQRLIDVAQLGDGAFATSAGYFHTLHAVHAPDGSACARAAFPALVAPASATSPARPDDATASAGCASVSVFAPTCALADGLTKLLALDPTAAPAVLRRFGASGLWLGHDGSVRHV